jgi:integrase
MKISDSELRYEYRVYQRQAKGADDKTIQASARAIVELSEFLDGTSLHDITREQVIAFKEQEYQRVGKRSNKLLAPSTRVHTLSALKQFFSWLSTHYGETSLGKRYACLIEYLTPSKNDVTRSRTSKQLSDLPTMDQVVGMVKAMPEANLENRRDKALLSLMVLIAPRVSAAVSLRIGHIDRQRRVVIQDGATVDTKFGKTIISALVPVDADLETYFLDYHGERSSMAGEDAPLFPCAVDAFGQLGASAERFWNSPNSVRRILASACERAGVPYFSPHKFRNFLALWGLKNCVSPEERKAFSQNIGHDIEQMTWNGYAKVPADSQIECVRSLQRRRTSSLGEKVQERFQSASQKEQIMFLHVMGMHEEARSLELASGS